MIIGLPSTITKQRKYIAAALVLALGGITYSYQSPASKLTSKGIDLIEDGSWNNHYLSSPEEKTTLPPFPYANLPDDTIINKGVPALPDSFFTPESNIERQKPFPIALYGKRLCTLFKDSRDIQTKLPSFVEGTINGSEAEAVCAAAALQFLLRVYGGLPNITPAAQEVFRTEGKTSRTLAEYFEKIGYSLTPAHSMDKKHLSPGDIIFARYGHSHFIDTAMNESDGKHPGTHTIIFLGEQTFSLPHPCPGNDDPVHIIKSRREKINDVHSERDNQDIEKYIQDGDIQISIKGDHVIITSLMLAHRLPHNGKVTSARIRPWWHTFGAKSKGSSINPNHQTFMPTEFLYMSQPEKFFTDTVQKDQNRRNMIDSIPTIGIIMLDDGETFSDHQGEIMSQYDISVQDWLVIVKYWKLITVRDRGRAHLPFPIPLIDDTTRDIINTRYNVYYKTESEWSVNRDAVNHYVDDYNATNAGYRSKDPSSILSSGWIMTTITGGTTKASQCNILRQYILTASHDKTYQQYIQMVDRRQVPDDKLRDAWCHSAQLISKEGLPCKVILDHPELIQSGTIYAYHLGSLLRYLSQDIIALSEIHKATINSFDQIDPMIARVITTVTPHADIQTMMATIHIRENSPSARWMIGHKRKTAKAVRDMTGIGGDNSSGGRWQISYSGFSHPSSIVEAIKYIQSLDIYQQWTSEQRKEIRECKKLANKIAKASRDKKTDSKTSNELTDYLRKHIPTWTIPNDDNLHRYIFEATLVANNLQKNKMKLISLISTLGGKAHNELSIDEQRSIDDLVCLTHNYGPNKVRQLMVINRLCRMIDETRISYRTGVDTDLIITPLTHKASRQRDNEVYHHYLGQIQTHIQACIEADESHSHVHITTPLQTIVQALEAGTEASLLDPRVQQAIKEFSQTNDFLTLGINMSLIPSIGELYGHDEKFSFDPSISREGGDSIKTVSRIHQPVISEMMRYLTQTPQDKNLLSLLLRGDGLVALLLVIGIGKRSYRIIDNIARKK